MIPHSSAAAVQVVRGRYRRVKVSRFGILCLVSLTLGVGDASAEDAGAAESLSERLDHMQSFSASFDQRIEAENGQVLETSKGVVYLRRPDRFLWQTFDPFPLIVYTDERSVYLYEQDLAQVTERDLEGVLDSTPAGVILTGGHRLAEQFEVVERLQSEEDVRVYSLLPLALQSEFLRIDLVFDQWALDSLFIEDVLGNRSIVQFSNRRLNEPIADERFEVSYPESVDRVRQ